MQIGAQCSASMETKSAITSKSTLIKWKSIFSDFIERSVCPIMTLLNHEYFFLGEPTTENKLSKIILIYMIIQMNCYLK